MKIGLISNSNNFYFTLCRYLRDMGYDAELILFPGETLNSVHHPSHDCYDETYLSYCRWVKWGKSNQHYFTKNALGFGNIKKLVKEDLERYDFLIGTQLAPAYCELIGFTLDIQFPMGIDTRSFPHYQWKRPKNKGKIIEWNIRAYFQKKGIQHSRHIITGLNDTQFIEKLKPHGQLWNIPLPIIYTGLYNPKALSELINESDLGIKFRAIRKSCDLMIVSQNKHGWDLYGNDKLIYAVFHAINNQPTLKVKVVFFEFGWHVQQSKNLIKELKLEEYFEWMPLMPRKELMYGLNLADLGINELSYGAFMAGSIFECMALGVPLIQFRNDEKHSRVFPELPPIINTNKIEELSKHIMRFSEHKKEYRSIGEGAMKWFNKYVIGESLAAIVSMIESKKKIYKHNK